MNHYLEPIHFSGSIQPHGILLVLSEPELTVVCVSANIQEQFGISEDLLNQSLSTLLDVQVVDAIRQSLHLIDSGSLIKLQESILVSERSFNALVHRTENFIILELEPTLPLGLFSVPAFVRRAIAKLRQVSTSHEFLQLVSQEVRRITEFDRVMIYQFDQHEAGTVMAEAKRDDLPSYLGLHYPATDIPEQVRALYARGLLRFIPNLTAQSIELVPASAPLRVNPLILALQFFEALIPAPLNTIKTWA
jgi:two-component system, chemotaxis family, sensor kinase Cph1